MCARYGPFYPRPTRRSTSRRSTSWPAHLSLFTDSVNHYDDFSFAVPSVGRFRANIFRQRGSYGAVIRVIPFGLPDPDEMNIPESVMRLADLNRGLVLVTGPTGCGKSTTLACMLDRMNHTAHGSYPDHGGPHRVRA